MLVAVASTEHKAILAAAHEVAHLGGAERVLPVDGDGQLEPDAFARTLAERPAVVSVMWVNNETGVIQPIASLAEQAGAAGVPLHTDLVQALGKLPLTLRDLPIGLATLSGHQIGAPKGIGALIVRDRDQLAPLVHGGGQQRGLRPGTENIAGAVGLGRAVALAASEVAGEFRRLTALQRELAARLRESLPDVTIVGGRSERAPHVLNLLVPGVDTGALLMHLDLAGLAASGGSACATGAIEPSHVLLAMGIPVERARGALRLSLGRTSTAADIESAAIIIPAVIDKLRQTVGAGHG